MIAVRKEACGGGREGFSKELGGRVMGRKERVWEREGRVYEGVRDVWPGREECGEGSEG